MDWNLIFNYIVIGLAVNFIFEVISKKQMPNQQFTILERIWLLITWPYTLMIFVFEIIRIMIYGRDENR